LSASVVDTSFQAVMFAYGVIASTDIDTRVVAGLDATLVVSQHRAGSADDERCEDSSCCDNSSNLHAFPPSCVAPAISGDCGVESCSFESATHTDVQMPYRG